MARVVADFTGKPEKVSKYPWTEWFDGRVWELERGVDFTPVLPNFRNIAYSKAKSAGKSLVVMIVSDTTIQIQASDRQTA